MGGEIEEIGVRLATKLGEKGIKSEINLKKKKKKKEFIQGKQPLFNIRAACSLVAKVHDWDLQGWWLKPWCGHDLQSC